MALCRAGAAGGGQGRVEDDRVTYVVRPQKVQTGEFRASRFLKLKDLPGAGNMGAGVPCFVCVLF